MKKFKFNKKNIIFIVIGIIGVISFFAHNYTSKSSENNNSVETNAEYTSKTPEEALKNTSFDGSFTDEEKSKIVESTDKFAKMTLNNDYKTDNVDTLKNFVNYMSDDLKANYSDDVLQKQIDNLVKNEHISKLQDITYTAIKKDTDNELVAVSFTATVKVVNDKDSKESGKTFSKVICGFAFDKNWKISKFSIGPYK
ncbi:hypothetical protein [Clostridium cibarium]|uniref:Uncharacterized protein n=1 Tax=Clostridium cibarium TaxID=2762247 RepID=A0ABR8PYC8_9CLOT|nr:hypothetical protein [Clostridium cibarium]MBD7913181.1 hypothetical protein [Clostridium cibarium]